MKTRHIRIGLALLALFCLSAANTQAATINYVGQVVDNAGNEISEWRTPGTTKSLDADGDNIYGTDGRLFYTVLGAFPGYLAYAGSQSQVGPFPGYAVVDHPDGVSPDTQVRTTTSGAQAVGSVHNMFWFNITSPPPPTGFRVGVVFDGLDGAHVSPQEIRLTQTVGGAATDSVVVEPFRNNTLDMVFFDVNGAVAGDQYAVQGVAGAGGYATHQIVTWDTLPIPPVIVDDQTLWSVDIQGAGSTLHGQADPPQLMSGVEPNYGYGTIWNAFDVPGHQLAAAAEVALNLVDSNGNPGSVQFKMTGGLAGWGGTSGAGPLTRDYAFFSAGNASHGANWEINGLVSGATYELYAYGGDPGSSRPFDMVVDQLGTAATSVPNTGLLFEDIVATSEGKITGFAGSLVDVAEQNWGGFQLQLVTIPEPGTLSLLALGGLGLAAAARRRRRG